MIRPFHWLANRPVGPFVGPGYIQALLAEDQGLLANYRDAFTDAELLDAIEIPLGLLVRYLGYHTNHTSTEIGDALVRATRRTERHTTA